MEAISECDERKSIASDAQPNVKSRVLALIVSYNRKDLLTRCIESIRKQTHKIETIWVIDNASTDGTFEHLTSAFPEVHVIRNSRNLGGAGGWEIGIKAAQEAPDGWDFIWMMDDDAWADPKALEDLLEGYSKIEPPPAFVCSRVVDNENRTVNHPHPYIEGNAELDWDKYLKEGYLPLQACSFVSVLYAKKVILGNDPPLGHYFLWWDDYEYTLRLSNYSPGWYIPKSQAYHVRPSGGGAPNLLKEESKQRIPLYSHFYANCIETMARHNRMYPSWARKGLVIFVRDFLLIARSGQPVKCLYLVQGIAIGYFRAIKYWLTQKTRI